MLISSNLRFVSNVLNSPTIIRLYVVIIKMHIVKYLELCVHL